jgi:hypothetical protein
MDGSTTASALHDIKSYRFTIQTFGFYRERKKPVINARRAKNRNFRPIIKIDVHIAQSMTSLVVLSELSSQETCGALRKSFCYESDGVTRE